MIFVEICVGSSCHLKGSEKVVELFQSYIKEAGLEDRIVLSGSFCLGNCNKDSVGIAIGDGMNDRIITGVKPEEFKEFWNETILPKLEESEA